MTAHITPRIRSFFRAITRLVILAALILPAPRTVQAATVIFVIPNGTGDGSSWGQGKDLAAALAEAPSGSELWVQAGTYKPTTGASRYATFSLKTGVAVYGGFAGAETDLGQRVLASHETILSGDIGDENNHSDDSYHVVIANGVGNTAVLDGFTIQFGRADQASEPGGGMRVINASPSLANLTFRSNYASMWGAGMYAGGNSSPTLTNVTFDSNTGGGMYNQESSPNLDTVTFSNNTATNSGAGMVNNASSPSLTNVTFEDNYAGQEYGAGMYNINASSPTLTHVTFRNNNFSDNTDSWGGGMANLGGSNPALTDVLFDQNSARSAGGGMFNAASSPQLTEVTFTNNTVFNSTMTSNGGGMANTDGSNPHLTNVTFRGNTAKKGAALHNASSAPILVNVLLSGNIASEQGGALFNSSSSPTLTNVTISGNTAMTAGSAMYNSTDSNPIVQNSILWGNFTEPMVVNDASIAACTPVYTFSIVQGSGGSGAAWAASLGTDGGGNLDLDPAFVTNPTQNQSASGDYHLQAASPAINNASASLVPGGVTADIETNPRAAGGAVDMGAYEYQSAALPPETSLTALPASTSADNTPSFSFSSSETGSSFQCKLDAGTWQSCSSPLTYAAQSDGAHTFQVYAVDGDGYRDWTPTRFSWTIDTTVDTRIDGAPAAYANATTATFTFSSPDDGISFECQMDGAAWAACSSPKSYDSLLEGSHTFAVRAADAPGNVDPSPASHTWLIDLTPPETIRSGEPTNPAAVSEATFTFSSNESQATFECQVDESEWAACASPKTYDLADGSHTFQVRAKDPAGNFDATPASYTWQVSEPPVTSLTGQPASLDNDSTASFTFTSNETNSTFLCQVDSAAWLACSSGQSYTGLSDGQHTFRVTAVDPAGNADATPVEYTWTIDTSLPNTTLDSHPENPSHSNQSVFTFSSAEAGTTFECKFNTGPWVSCANSMRYYPLTDGAYTFQVRAIDSAGNLDPSPASYTWTVEQAHVVALPAGVVSSGFFHTCALVQNGSAHCWGAGEDGQSGDNNFGQSIDQAGPYLQVSAGGVHTCALKPDGSVHCWGAGEQGQSGDYQIGQAVDQAGPYRQVSAGMFHTCAIKMDGSVDCWGAGEPNATGSHDHGQASDQAGVYLQVSAGYYHTCGLKKDGSIHCWGAGEDGASGGADFGQSVDQAGPYLQVSAGGTHSCGLKPDGSIHCWGDNSNNQAGDHAGPYLQVSASPLQTCALTLTGAVDCWGTNGETPAVGQVGPFTQVSSGATNACALTAAQGITCWGEPVESLPGPFGAAETSAVADPASELGAGQARFVFESDDAQASFECRLDGGVWAGCASPASYTGLADGAHTFEVRSVNADHLPDFTPARLAWTAGSGEMPVFIPLVTR